MRATAIAMTIAKDNGKRGGNCNDDDNGNGNDRIARTMVRARAVAIGMTIGKKMTSARAAAMMIATTIYNGDVDGNGNCNGNEDLQRGLRLQGSDSSGVGWSHPHYLVGVLVIVIVQRGFNFVVSFCFSLVARFPEP